VKFPKKEKEKRKEKKGLSQALCKIYKGICLQRATLQKRLILREKNYNRVDPLRDFEEE
jgi:hypothetical protein